MIIFLWSGTFIPSLSVPPPTSTDLLISNLLDCVTLSGNCLTVLVSVSIATKQKIASDMLSDFSFINCF